MKSIRDIDDLLLFAETWQNLGTCVAEQVARVLRGDSECEENPNAIEYALREFRQFPEIARPLEEWLRDWG
jgi:hypothetical protein